MVETLRNTENAPRIFLEIGPGPVPAAATSTRKFSHDVYVGVEKNGPDYYEDDMFQQQREAVAGRIRDENIMLTEGDARDMLFPDESVHEVFLGNVINGIPKNHRNPMLEEIYRVMDGTGPLIIDVDSEVEQDESGFFTHLDEYLEDNGFTVEEIVNEHSTPERWQHLHETWPSGAWLEGHTFVIAHKAVETAQEAA